MLTKNCEVCGLRFKVKPYRITTAKFCSSKCYGISEKGLHPKSEFKKGQRPSPKTEFKPGKKHPYFGKSSPALGKKWGLSGKGLSLRLEIMGRPEYRKWRKDVFFRDKWTCVFCGQVGGKLHADHIKPFNLYPELIFSLENGRTLCVLCHRKTDTYGGKSRKKSV